MRKIFAILLRSFLQGLVIVGPIGVTAYAIFFVITGLDSLLPFAAQMGPGLGFVSVIVLITVVGYLGTKFLLGRWLVETFDNLLDNTPGIKYIYTSVKDVMGSFVGDKKKFNHPVWVKTNNNPELWRIGFLTQKDMSQWGEQDKVAVYLPHSYAISGWVIIVNKDMVKDVKGMNAAEAMKFAVSGGVTGTVES
jgi:uncharacterized membrane protein